jgi:hypothetical protein
MLAFHRERGSRPRGGAGGNDEGQFFVPIASLILLTPTLSAIGLVVSG